MKIQKNGTANKNKFIENVRSRQLWKKSKEIENI